jgi:methyl-accepting chemotaxis protein
MKCVPKLLKGSDRGTRVRQAGRGLAGTLRQCTSRQLKRILTSVSRHRDSDSTGRGLGTLPEHVIADLENLNRCTERDFLAIGGKLAEFLAAARQLASDMAALSELISGRSGGHATAVLSRVLERSTQAEAGDRALASVCESARQIGGAFQGFRDIVSLFRVLGSLTRIETARLGAAGVEFGSLAEEVNALTENIESSGQGVLDASSLLHQNVQSALAKISGLRDQELMELPAIIVEVRTSLESLEDRHRRAIEASLHQAAEYKELSAAIEDLITAIQFHDITRQQIEHVAEALTRIRAGFPEGHSAAPPKARAVLTLQSSQLANAEQIFASSVGRVERDLDSIGGRVREMAKAGKTLLGLSADEQGCFLLQMEDHFKAISKIAGICAGAETETQVTLAELKGTVARIQEAVAKIREIEMCIRRIAINATIRAVQLGDAGTALNVIADVMQRLALDSSGITDEVAGTLDAIVAAANRLSIGSGWRPAGEQSQPDEVLSEMNTTILELHSASASSFAHLNHITALCSRLSEDIQSVRAGFSSGRLLSEGIDRARVALEEIGGPPWTPVAGESDGTVERHLEGFAAHYTMQTERDVHESVAIGTRVGAGGPNERIAERIAPAGGSNSVMDEEDLGDNVELF